MSPASCRGSTSVDESSGLHVASLDLPWALALEESAPPPEGLGDEIEEDPHARLLAQGGVGEQPDLVAGRRLAGRQAPQGRLRVAQEAGHDMDAQRLLADYQHQLTQPQGS